LAIEKAELPMSIFSYSVM